MSKVIIYTDGGCRNNQSQDKSKVLGGWGVVLKWGDKEKEMYGGKKGFTTNNEMELTAVLHALQAMKRKDLPITMYIDSQYTINVVTKWMEGWRANNWCKKDGKSISNKELVIEIYNLYKQFKDITIVWTKGHDNDAGNIRADQLVNIGMNELI